MPTNTTTTDREVTMAVATISEIMSADCGARFVTLEGNQSLVVNHRSFGAAAAHGMTDEAFTAAVVSNTIRPMEVTLTDDGRSAWTGEWHSGPEADWVQVETWTHQGRVFHGFVDSVSRKLLQAG